MFCVLQRVNKVIWSQFQPSFILGSHFDIRFDIRLDIRFNIGILWKIWCKTYSKYFRMTLEHALHHLLCITLKTKINFWISKRISNIQYQKNFTSEYQNEYPISKKLHIHQRLGFIWTISRPIYLLLTLNTTINMINPIHHLSIFDLVYKI